MGGFLDRGARWNKLLFESNWQPTGLQFGTLALVSDITGDQCCFSSLCCTANIRVSTFTPRAVTALEDK